MQNNFDTIKINLASPQKILEWSGGEVTIPETIDYRSQKPVKGGLFCESIFGSANSWSCDCGKYKKVRYNNEKCEVCHSDVSLRNVRRERMGHINLEYPVAHIWYFKNAPSKIAILLDMAPKEVEDIIYFKTDYNGSEYLYSLLKQIDLKHELEESLELLKTARGERYKKILKRYEILKSFYDSGNRPEWMILTVLPVIPPDVRPMLQLDGGKFATSDINDIYRQIISINNRIKMLKEMDVPNILLRQEQLKLQEAVDTLIDNEKRKKPEVGSNNRALKSLSHSLKGKQGRFRQNLLGKRVDFSGRSVIAVGPNLKMNQCGLPKLMAIELYKPFLINVLVEKNFAQSTKQAEKLIEEQNNVIWAELKNIMDNHPVFLNRAPTLHRLGIQAFNPILVEGKAIRLHPLVCTAFNADFDGDQMAVHLPLSTKAIEEAENIMLANNNILGLKDGKPICTPSQDMVLGIYYLSMEETEEELNKKGFYNTEGKIFKSFEDAEIAYNNKIIHLHSRIFIEYDGKYLLTTFGKMILNNVLPEDYPYINSNSVTKLDLTNLVEKNENLKEYLVSKNLNSEITKKDLNKLIIELFNRYGAKETAKILDNIKDLGFEYSTYAGTTVSIFDINVPKNKKEYVEDSKKTALKLKRCLERGLLTQKEWERLFKNLWDTTRDKIGDEFMDNLERMSPIRMLGVSGARGSKSNFIQMAGMRGIMARPGHNENKSSIIEVPIYSSFREGMNISEFFIGTHGIRKGLTDTALKTAESGYLTRRLVDVSQDIIISEDDCGTTEKYLVEELREDNTLIEPLYNRILGRYCAETLYTKDGQLICKNGELITEKIANEIVENNITKVYIRNAFTCHSKTGICAKCYGRHLANNKTITSGEAVGIIAAQSIGEPGTQLTMRTFHTGGVASSDEGDITQGLPRIEELFEARTPKLPAVLSKVSGNISNIYKDKDKNTIITINGTDHKCYPKQHIKDYLKIGYNVSKGEKLTDGNINTKELLAITDCITVQNYILKEVQKVYASQGIDINDKHIEIIIKQMMKQAVITKSNNPDYLVGEIYFINSLYNIPDIEYNCILQGISKAAINTDSWLSAASFQETTKVLIDAAISGKEDKLKGLKENVIIGRLIPAGTGSK